MKKKAQKQRSNSHPEKRCTSSHMLWNLERNTGMENTSICKSKRSMITERLIVIMTSSFLGFRGCALTAAMLKRRNQRPEATPAPLWIPPRWYSLAACLRIHRGIQCGKCPNTMNSRLITWSCRIRTATSSCSPSIPATRVKSYYVKHVSLEKRTAYHKLISPYLMRVFCCFLLKQNASFYHVFRAVGLANRHDSIDNSYVFPGFD